MKKGLVLIAEDNDDIRELYTDAFDLAGMNVITARNGEEAVALALEQHPNVILMDIEMPKMNGHDAVSKIRADDWGKDAKIIYLTNKSDAENVVHAVHRKSDEYIVKSNTELSDIVNRARAIMYS